MAEWDGWGVLDRIWEQKRAVWGNREKEAQMWTYLVIMDWSYFIHCDRLIVIFLV